MAHVKDRGHVGLQQPLERIRREILWRGTVLRACIADQNVDGARRGLEPVDGLAHGVVISHVEGQRLDRSTFVAQGDRRRLQLGRVASVQHDARACGGHSACEGKAYPLRRPDDQRALVGQIE